MDGGPEPDERETGAASPHRGRGDERPSWGERAGDLARSPVFWVVVVAFVLGFAVSRCVTSGEDDAAPVPGAGGDGTELSDDTTLDRGGTG